MDKNEEIKSKTRVSVDGDLSSQKLLSLIKIGAEEERLDYKRTYQISGKQKTKDKVELVKDAISMANTYGGYIVLGVHEKKVKGEKRFIPIGIPDEDYSSLDISAIRDQIESFVSVRTNIKFQIHELEEHENKKFAFIYVPPSLESPVILEKDGNYQDSKSRTVKAFSQGDIFVRKGASSEKADQGDIRRLISDLRRREKSQWTEEILEIRSMTQRMEKLINLLDKDKGLMDVEIFERETNSFDESMFFLSSDYFGNKIIELLELNKEISIKHIIRTAPQLFIKSVELLSSIEDENKKLEIVDNKLLPILDNLVAMGLIFVDYANIGFLEDIKQAFYIIFRNVETYNFPDFISEKTLINKIWVWQEIIIRIYAIGSLLVDKEKWEFVKNLIEQEIEWDEYYRNQYWSRYVLTMASRANQLKHKGWVPAVVEYIESHNWISSYFYSDKEEITNHVCQFDFLQCVYLEQKNVDKPANAYPSFGNYYRSRTEPIISKLISPGELRDTVSDLSDEKLAIIIFELNRIAEEQFFWSGWGAYGWRDTNIIDYIKRNYPSPK